MIFNPVRIIMLGAATMLCPTAIFAQGGSAYMQASMSQDPSQQGRPQQAPSQQPAMLPSMQDSIGNTGDNPQTMKDKMFLRQAAEGGIAEVQLGQLAAQKGGSEEVKTFGQKMVDDHTALSKTMEPIADTMGVKLPSHMNKTNQAEYDKLKAMSGDEFDTEYLTQMVKDHHQDLRDFRLEAANTQDPALRDAVVKGQRVIHDHLVMVNELAKSKGIVVPGRHGNRPPSPPPPPPTE